MIGSPHLEKRGNCSIVENSDSDVLKAVFKVLENVLKAS